MNKFISTLVLSSLLIATGFSQNEPEKDPEGIIPVSPVVLLEALPANPKTWKLTRSTGERRLSGWIESRVVREFEKKVPDPKNPEKVERTLVTRVTITDTGKFPESIAAFADFKPEKFEDYEKTMIQGYPAVVVPYDDEVEIQLLVKGRFLVEYILENQPRRYLKEWMQHTKFELLGKIKDTAVSPLPSEINVLKIDQLKPDNNSVYLLATTSNSEQAKSLAEDEILQKKLDGEIPALPGELDFLSGEP